MQNLRERVDSLEIMTPLECRLIRIDQGQKKDNSSI